MDKIEIIIEEKYYNIFGMNSLKLKQLKQVVYGNRRQKHQTIKLRKQTKKTSLKCHIDMKMLPILFYGFFSFQKFFQLEKFCQQIYMQTNYAVNNLRSPPIKLIQSKKIRLPTQNKRILFLDLDSTLIYCNSDIQYPEVELYHVDINLKMNIRPYCRRFLKKMSKIFDIFIFTASSLQYAHPIIKYLNDGRGFIKGVLHRQHCLKTKNGLFIKDLRIVENKQLKDMIIIDNKIHSFSFQLQNGIPIQDYVNNSKDEVLLKLEQFLVELSDCQNVQQFLKQKLKLREILYQNQNSFTQEVSNSYTQFLDKGIQKFAIQEE